MASFTQKDLKDILKHLLTGKSSAPEAMSISEKLLNDIYSLKPSVGRNILIQVSQADSNEPVARVISTIIRLFWSHPDTKQYATTVVASVAKIYGATYKTGGVDLTLQFLKHLCQVLLGPNTFKIHKKRKVEEASTTSSLVFIADNRGIEVTLVDQKH